MYRKNLHEYLESKQNPDDIYYIYGKQKRKIAEQLTTQAAGEYLLNEAAATLREENKKAFKK